MYLAVGGGCPGHPVAAGIRVLTRHGICILSTCNLRLVGARIGYEVDPGLEGLG